MIIIIVHMLRLYYLILKQCVPGRLFLEKAMNDFKKKEILSIM